MGGNESRPERRSDVQPVPDWISLASGPLSSSQNFAWEASWSQPMPQPSTLLDRDEVKTVKVGGQTFCVDELLARGREMQGTGEVKSAAAPERIRSHTANGREYKRIMAARARSKSRSPGRLRGRSPSSRSASVNVSVDDEFFEEAEADGITAIQSALGSSHYRSRVDEFFLDIRQRQDLKTNGPTNERDPNMVRTFFKKKDRQNILEDERKVVGSSPARMIHLCACLQLLVLMCSVSHACVLVHSSRLSGGRTAM